MLGHARGDRALIAPEVRDWLKRVVKAAEKRNEAMHAVARDQCVLCGDATRFEHKGRPVDRSAAAVEAVSASFRDLIDEGVRHARGIADALNERVRAAAVRTAAATGTIQTPRQVLIGQNLYRCAACSPGGNWITVASARAYAPAPASAPATCAKAAACSRDSVMQWAVLLACPAITAACSRSFACLNGS